MAAGGQHRKGDGRRTGDSNPPAASHLPGSCCHYSLMTSSSTCSYRYSRFSGRPHLGIKLFTWFFFLLNHQVQISVSAHEDMTPPYGKCSNNIPLQVYSYLGENMTYTENACMETCAQNYIAKTCHCLELLYPTYSTARKYPSLSQCSSSYKTLEQLLEASACITDVVRISQSMRVWWEKSPLHCYLVVQIYPQIKGVNLNIVQK